MRRLVPLFSVLLAGLILLPCGAAWARKAPPGPAHPYLIVNQAELLAVRDRIAVDEPWHSAWLDLRAQAESYVDDTPSPPPPLTGSEQESTYFLPLSEDGKKVRALALAYWMSGDTRYADAARTFMMAYADPVDGYEPVTYAMWHDDNGDMAYQQSWGSFCFAWAYDLLWSQIPSDESAVIASWLTAMSDAQVSSRLTASLLLGLAQSESAWIPYTWNSALATWGPDRLLGDNYYVMPTTSAMACALVVRDQKRIDYLADHHVVTASTYSASRDDDDHTGTDGRHPFKAVDGLAETRWKAGADLSQWFQVDFCDASHLSSGIQIDWYKATERRYRYSVSVSVDGTTWDQVVEPGYNTTPRDDQNGAPHVTQDMWSSTRSMRYVKVEVANARYVSDGSYAAPAITDLRILDANGQPIALNIGGWTQQIDAMLDPTNTGDGVDADDDGVPDHGVPVPSMYIDPPSGRTLGIDYSTYNARVAFTDLMMGRALRARYFRTAPAFTVAEYSDRFTAQWAYLRLFFGAEAEPNPNQLDTSDLTASAKRFVLPLWATHDPAYETILRYYRPTDAQLAGCWDPQWLGPLTLLFWYAPPDP